MSEQGNNTESVGSNAGASSKPDPKLLRLHLIGAHELIPLNKPDARRENRPIGKAPLEPNWRARKYSEDQIKTWMLKGHNVGVRLRDDQLVIDVDPRNFEGKDRLAELCATFGIKLDDYPCVYSGGGGRHIYMSKPLPLRIRAALKEFPGIEFKTKGTLLVASGSVHPDTKNYYRAEDPFNDFIKPREAPDALLQALARSDTSSRDASPAMLSPEQVEKFLAVIDPAKYRKYDDWLRLMMACHAASNELAVEEFVAWATSDPEYAAHEASNREKWDTLDCEKQSGITAATLFKAVCDAGRPDLISEMQRQPAAQDFSVFDEGGSENPQRTQFREWSLEELSVLEEPKWLVNDLVPDGGLAVVYGQPKSCKTFWALDLALCVATGRSFHGLDTRPGKVTYVAAEGGPVRLYERAAAWAKANGVKPPAAWKLVAGRVDLTDRAEVRGFVEALGGARDLIVIDTLARCMSGDENTQKDMSAFVAGCDRIRAATGAAVLVIHHEGKDAGKGARGSNVLRGAVDTGIRVKREDSGSIVVSVEDQRDGEPLAQMHFTLENVPLDGIERASAALREAAASKNRLDELMFRIASGMNGASKSAFDAVVAEEAGLTLSTALRRTREAIPVGRERAVFHMGRLIWFERLDAMNKRSGLILRVSEISDVTQDDVSDV